MYAIIEAGGQQFRVSPGDTIKVQNMGDAATKEISLEKVLMVSGDDKVHIGSPLVANARVKAEILRTEKADKVLVYKQRPRKGYRKLNGHRQGYTVLKIGDIVFGG